MNRFTKGVVALLTIGSIGVWGIAIFLFVTNDDSVPVKNHVFHSIQHVDKGLLVYKNKQEMVEQNQVIGIRQYLKTNFKNNRVSIDELLAALTQEE